MRIPRRIGRAAAALVFLASASDVFIFHGGATATLLRKAVASVPEGLFEFSIALLSGLGLLGLLIYLPPTRI